MLSHYLKPDQEGFLLVVAGAIVVGSLIRAWYSYLRNIGVCVDVPRNWVERWAKAHVCTWRHSRYHELGEYLPSIIGFKRTCKLCGRKWEE